MKRVIVLCMSLAMVFLAMAQRVSVVISKGASAREQYAAEYLQKKLTDLGYTIVSKKADCTISLYCLGSGASEGYSISRDKKAVSTGFQGIVVTGNDPSGVIYGCVELADRIRQKGSLDIEPTTETPGMVMRGTCIGLQKTVYLPGHAVYEYPYTPVNFPWFYDKQEWIKYLDMMV